MRKHRKYRIHLEYGIYSRFDSFNSLKDIEYYLNNYSLPFELCFFKLFDCNGALLCELGSRSTPYILVLNNKRFLRIIKNVNYEKNKIR